MISPFEEFLRAQPADRIVDHLTWHSCAVGDYQRDIGEVTVVESKRSSDGLECIDPMKEQILELDSDIWLGVKEECSWGERDDGRPSFYDVLNCGKTIAEALPDLKLGTYGGLVAVLDQCTYDPQ